MSKKNPIQNPITEEQLLSLEKGDVVHFKYRDVKNELSSCVSIVIFKKIHEVEDSEDSEYELDIRFKDIIDSNNRDERELETDWRISKYQYNDFEIVEVLFNYKEKSLRDVLFEKYPEFGI